MFDPRKFPVAKILLPFAAGAAAGYQMEPSFRLPGLILISALAWLSLFLLHRCPPKQSRRFVLAGALFSTVGFFLLLLLGYGTGRTARPSDPELTVGELVVIRGEILGEPKRGGDQWSMEMKLFMIAGNEAVCHTRTRLRVYLGIPPDSIVPAAGELWQLAGRLVSVRNSGNPGEPDYEAILHRKDIWYSFFAHPWNPGNRRVQESGNSALNAGSIRRAVSDQWKGEGEAVSLLKAVCLGDRSGLTPGQQHSYSAAGGMHLLAVSGLHVGLIWWVLNRLLSWTVCLHRREGLRAVAIIAMLWGYAFLTGFSSSVSRAVTMFTLFTLGRLTERRIHPVNGILLSAFLLIMVNPGRLFEVGFQLSYSAILGIAFLFPVMSGWWTFNNRILKWIWEGCLVSLAAQLSTAPLVIYYFHQLPVYALITNLVAIPMLMALVGLFVLSLPLMVTGVLTGWSNAVLIFLGNLLNRWMGVMASLPGAVMDELSLDRVNLCLMMILGFLAMVALVHRSAIPRYLILISMAGTLGWNSWSRCRKFNTAEMVVAHFNGCSMVSFREGFLVEHYRWCREGLSAGPVDDYIYGAWNRRRYHHMIFELGDSVQIRGSISCCMEIRPGLWRMGTRRARGWVITGSPGTDHLELLGSQPASFILFSCEPRLGRNFFYDGAVACDLIADGSNRRWYLGQMEPGAEGIHLTAQEGAYRKRW